MSFLRHREIYRSDGGAEAGSGAVAAPCLIVSMSLRLAIPWPVALQQSRLPLHQLGLLCTQPAGKTTIFQRMAKAGLTACLSLGVHSIRLHPGLTSGRRFAAQAAPASDAVSRLTEGWRWPLPCGLGRWAPVRLRRKDVHRARVAGGLRRGAYPQPTAVGTWWPGHPKSAAQRRWMSA